MANVYKFECGCSFPVIKHNLEFPHIDFEANIENINLNCSKTWKIISDGNTKGCFQLESRLGQTMAKKLKPENIEQLSALISILRPGCLEAYREGKSVSNHYIDKKNGLESVDYYHDSLKDILSSTYGEMIYQEQSMQIAQSIAGFDLQEADMLRKAIGKKKPEEMAKVKTKFIDGCHELGILNEEQAHEIFNWIEKSQRYSFNKSHAVSYAMNAYLSAYAKAHFPKIFFASYLRYAKDKIDPQQEIKELTRNAIEMDISISIPDLRLLNRNFILTNSTIYFGLTDIKGVGNSVYGKLIDIVKESKLDINNMNWPQILSKILLKINSTASKALISCGALDFLKKNRTEMLFEYDICSGLTKKELEHFEQNSCVEPSTSKNLLYVANQNRINKKRKENIAHMIHCLKNPAYSLLDKIEWLSDSENSLLGVSITCSKIDTYDIRMANINCREFKKTTIDKNIVLAAEISNINVTKTKSGKNPGLEMCFVSAEDSYGMLDSIVVFPEQYKKYRDHLYVGNVLIFIGNKNKNKDSLIVDKCFAPSS